MTLDSLDSFDELGLGIDHDITYIKWTTINEEVSFLHHFIKTIKSFKEKNNEAGRIVTQFKKLKGESTKLQFTVGGSEGKFRLTLSST